MAVSVQLHPVPPSAASLAAGSWLVYDSWLALPLLFAASAAVPLAADGAAGLLAASGGGEAAATSAALGGAGLCLPRTAYGRAVSALGTAVQAALFAYGCWGAIYRFFRARRAAAFGAEDAEAPEGKGHQPGRGSAEPTAAAPAAAVGSAVVPRSLAARPPAEQRRLSLRRQSLRQPSPRSRAAETHFLDRLAASPAWDTAGARLWVWRPPTRLAAAALLLSAVDVAAAVALLARMARAMHRGQAALAPAAFCNVAQAVSRAAAVCLMHVAMRQLVAESRTQLLAAPFLVPSPP